MALQTSPEAPLPVGDVSRLIGGWIDRLGAVWVEGQITQLSRRPGAGVVFLTLRDPSHDISVSVTCFRQAFDRIADVVTEGARVVVLAKPEWYAPRGQLSLRATEIRPVGIGELLVRLEQLKKSLASEGLFALDRKKPLPFLPQLIGLVCGRASAAERDVLENARRRWPAVRFEVRNTAVQGVHAVNQVVHAVKELDAVDEVDVIVVARGGGSVEDLLPFSDEELIRTVAACRTPVVSAIGHEPDSPCSTWSPTCGPPPPRTRRRGSCPMWARSWTASSSCGTGRCGRYGGCSTGRSGVWRTRWGGPPWSARSGWWTSGRRRSTR